MQPSFDSNIHHIADQLKFRASLFAYFMINKKCVSDNTWIYFSEKKYIFRRIYEQRNYSQYTVSPGKTALCLEISCNENDNVWCRQDDKLFKDILDDLTGLNLLKENELYDFKIMRIKDTYPVYSLYYKEKLNSLLSHISKIENLISNGRQGLFNYNNMDHSIHMGFLAGQYVASCKESQDGWQNIIKTFDAYKLID